MRNPIQWISKIVGAFLCLTVAFVLCLLLLRHITYALLPGTNWLYYRPVDWMVYCDASRALITGGNPYEIAGFYQFYNAPWVLIPILPFTLLPYPYGLAAFMVVGFTVHITIYRRYNNDMLSAIFYIISAPVFWGMVGGQLDWLILLGTLLPPQFGLFFVLAKPQVGLVVALVWLLYAYRTGRAIQTFAPVIIAFVLSFIAYGVWPLRWIGLVAAEPNVQWPYVLPVGLLYFTMALRHFNIRWALCASPMLSPHTLIHSWCGFLINISNPILMGILCILSWTVLL